MSDIVRHEVPNRFHELSGALLLLAATGAAKSIIAEKAGLDRGTLSDWLANADEWAPEVGEWKRQFEAARAGAHLSAHEQIAASNKTEDQRWLLERMRPEDYGAKHDGFGPRPADMAKPLSEAQEDHRMIQMLAHPTKRMRRCLAEALRKAGPGLVQLVDEYVRSRPLVVEGTEAEPEQLAAAPQTDLGERKLAFQALLAAHPRVALGGTPKAGKTTVFAPLCTDRPIVHTDDFIEDMTDVGAAERARRWKEAADKALVQCSGLPAFLLEGVRATGVIKAGLEIDVLVWLGTPLVPLTKGQETQRKGRETTLEKLMAEMPQLKVVRL